MKKILFTIAILISFIGIAQNTPATATEQVAYIKKADGTYVKVGGGSGITIIQQGSSSGSSGGYTYLDITSNNQTLIFSSTVKTWVRVLGDYDVNLPSNMPVGLPVVIQAMENVTDSIQINISEDVRFTGIKNYGDNEGVAGYYLSRLEKSVVTEDDNNIKDVDCACTAFFNSLYGDFVGSKIYLSSTNHNWTTETSATITDAGNGEAQVTSLNSSGGDFASLETGITTEDTTTYTISGEILYQSGAFAHFQLREVGGVSAKFEADITNTTTWQPFTVILNIANAQPANLVIDAATPGSFKFRKIQ